MATPSTAARLSAATPSTALPRRIGPGVSPTKSRRALVMRKYQISALRADGDIRQSEQIGPALPLFEAAFSAFARGTLIQTAHGPVAIEDLLPGDEIVTAEYGPTRLLWVGSMTLVPKPDSPAPPEARMTRVMPEAFGMGKPMTNIMFGPGARVLAPAARLREQIGNEKILTPMHHLHDGHGVIEVMPPRPVSVYHLCLAKHATINAGGLSVESYHPGSGFERKIGDKMLGLFLSFFPHIKAPHEFGGLSHLRLPLMSADELEAA
ncbi:Hint domain-containing protein [uncultured Roseovarius sp.]|uniref:Hint domain-containing protein n=1 Tax=uncultured Roseovarius sp. TaxID=293344 RepID=UPI0025D582BF|nr:Hint domain-containing protein [uncultured Roseovarius sp.]